MRNRPPLFKNDARWIWHGDDRCAYHEYVQFQRTFTLSREEDERAGMEGATLMISADAMYQAWLNGRSLGHGPAKSAEGMRSVDRYDIGPLLLSGGNRLEVLVLGVGVGTMTYCLGKAGLLFQLDLAGRTAVVSDSRVLARRDPGRARRTVRRWMMPCLEDVDAAAGEGKWLPARVVPGKARLYPRRVPLPSRQPLPPRRLVRADVVAFPNFSYSLRLKPYLTQGAEARRNNIITTPAYIVTDIVSPVAQQMEFAPALGNIVWYFQGRVVFAGSGWTAWEKSRFKAIIRLRKGANRLVGVHRHSHFEDINLCAFVSRPVRAVNPLGPGAFQVIPAKKVPAPPGTPDPAAPTTAQTTGGQSVDINRLDWDALTRAMPSMDAEHTMIQGNAQDLVTNARVLRPAHVESVAPLILPPGGPDEAVRVILDLGVLQNGWLAFDAIGHEGGRLIVSCAEAIDEGPPCRIQWPTGCNNALTYRLRGGRQSFESFLPYGVRYLLVHHTGRRPVRIDNLHILTANCGSQRRGSLVSSDRLLNGVYDLCAQTVISATDDTFTDCPTYEQVNWNFDNRMTFMTDALSCANTAVARNSIELFAEDSRYRGLVRSQYPSNWDNRIPLWSFHWIMLCRDYHWQTSDARFVARLYPRIAAGIREALAMLDPHGLLLWPQGHEVWHFVEWGHGRDDNHAVVTAEQAGLVGAIDAAVRLGRIVGHDGAELRRWSQARGRIIQAVKRRLWNADKDCFADSLHEDGSVSPVCSQVTNAILAIHGAGSAPWRRRLCDRIIAGDTALLPYGSPCGAYYVLELLDSFGEVEAIFDIIRRQWGQMVLAGDTTVWETFPEFGRGEWPTRSRCHPFASYVTKYLVRYALGIEPLAPGYARVGISPHPPKDMTFCGGSVPTPYGMLRVQWEQKADRTIVHAEAPTGMTLKIDPNLERMTGATVSY